MARAETVKGTRPALTREQFDALSPAGQRVAVARDALAQMEVGAFRPSKNGGWLMVPFAPDSFAFTQDDLTAESRPACYGCALGGVLHSTVRLGNAFEASYGFVDASEIESRLADLFGEQATLIELAYERGVGAYEPREAAGGDDAVAFGERLRGHRQRFRAIMQNIIDNNGDFLPGKES